MFSGTNISNTFFIACVITFILFILFDLFKTKQDLKVKDRRLIDLFFHNQFLKDTLNKYYLFQQSEEYSERFLANLKKYFFIEEINIISLQELENNEYLRSLFKEDIDKAIASFRSKDEIKAISQCFGDELNADADYEHRLYAYLPINEKNWRNKKSLFYVKTQYGFTKDEFDTLSTAINMYRLFLEKKTL